MSDFLLHYWNITKCKWQTSPDTMVNTHSRYTHFNFTPREIHSRAVKRKNYTWVKYTWALSSRSWYDRINRISWLIWFATGGRNSLSFFFKRYKRWIIKPLHQLQTPFTTLSLYSWWKRTVAMEGHMWKSKNSFITSLSLFHSSIFPQSNRDQQVYHLLHILSVALV